MSEQMEQKAMQPSPLFLERLKLYEDTVACRRTDRVLAAPLIMYLPIFLYGDTTIREVMMDYGKAKNCFIRYHQEY